jgi:DNA-binding NarL/FixJ family response regulator
VKQYKILLVEDTPTEAYYIEQAIKSNSELQLAFRAMNGKLAMSVLKRRKFDLVLLDLFMPIMDGFETLASIKQIYPEQKVLIISSFNSENLSHQLFKLGANGFSSKTKKCLIPAIETCLEKGLAFEKKYVQEANQMQNEVSDDYPKLIIGERDLKIVKLLAKGYQTEEISSILNLSPRSIETYIRNLITKLHVRNRVQLISFAYENGLLP